jgi:hypothetical protein
MPKPPVSAVYRCARREPLPLRPKEYPRERRPSRAGFWLGNCNGDESQALVAFFGTEYESDDSALILVRSRRIRATLAPLLSVRIPVPQPQTGHLKLLFIFNIVRYWADRPQVHVSGTEVSNTNYYAASGSTYFRSRGGPVRLTAR